jgi:23S rRNA (guanosine2251-2'-O)-methyltransferase
MASSRSTGGRGNPNAAKSGAGKSGAGRSGAGRSGAGKSASGKPASKGRSGNLVPKRPAKTVGGGAGRTAPARAGAGHGGARSSGPQRPTEKALGGQQVEGRQAVRELLIAGNRKVHEVLVLTDTDGAEVVQDIIDLARSLRVPVQEVSRKRLDTMARSEAPQGVLAHAAPLPEVELDQLLKRRPGRPPFLVAVDGVTDPGNLGAIVRSADGAGVTGMVLPRHRAVHVTPTAAKAAAGAVEHVPMAVVGGLPSALARMKDAGIWVVGLDDAADRNLFELGELAAEGICLVLGAEGAGLSRLVRERCDLVVHIPMRGRLSSLNVSAAAALACYEVARRRT